LVAETFEGNNRMNAKQDHGPSFRELEILAAVPQSTLPPEVIYSQRITAAETEARNRLGAFLAAHDEIASDPRLTAEGKKEACKKVAAKLLQAHDTSRALEKAQESVAAQMARWVGKVGATLKPPGSHVEAVLHAQIRDKVAAMKEERARLSFLQKHGSDPTIAAALLLAPAFLSGLSEHEAVLVKSKIEEVALPVEVREARIATAKALAALERSWRNVQARLTAGGGLVKVANKKGNAGAAARRSAVACKRKARRWQRRRARLSRSVIGDLSARLDALGRTDVVTELLSATFHGCPRGGEGNAPHRLPPPIAGGGRSPDRSRQVPGLSR
jgi:hypothetical protein